MLWTYLVEQTHQIIENKTLAMCYDAPTSMWVRSPSTNHLLPSDGVRVLPSPLRFVTTCNNWVFNGGGIYAPLYIFSLSIIR